jgi:hypothetical protein
MNSLVEAAVDGERAKRNPFEILHGTDRAFDYGAIDIDLETPQRIPCYDPSRLEQHNANLSHPLEDTCGDYVMSSEVIGPLGNPTHSSRRSSTCSSRVAS